MEQNNQIQDQQIQNLKKWIWWAAAGIVTILAIVGFIIATTSFGPKPADETTTPSNETNDQPISVGGGETADNNKEETKSPTQNSQPGPAATVPSSDLPKTGPENAILPIFGAGIAGYLVALAATFIRRRN